MLIKEIRLLRRFPITTNSPIEVNVLPNTAPFNSVSMELISFLMKEAELQVFDPQKTTKLGLMVMAEFAWQYRLFRFTLLSYDGPF